MKNVATSMRSLFCAARLLSFMAAVCIFLLSGEVGALPVFARQTGQQCVACHAGGQFPELTPFGRLFKLTGYTIGTRTLPLSAMGVASFTKSREPTDDPAFAKDAVALFQTGSIFVAGKISDHAGVFAQATYDNYASQNPGNGHWDGKWLSDNIDLRYAGNFSLGGKGLIAGISLNNNPSLADPWNTVPAWINYVPTTFGVTGPDAAPIIAQLGQQAVGVGAYALWDQHVYVELAGYRTANGIWSLFSQGIDNVDQVKLNGLAPYFRLALNHDWGAHSAMIGAFAMNADVYPDNLAPTGPTIGYRDRGIDAQYQYLLEPHTLTLQLSYIRETISRGDLGGIASNATNKLDQLRLKASYINQHKYGLSLGYFDTTGSSDNTLYPDPAGSPGTRGWVPEVFYMPEQHVRLGAQYYAFNRFHGVSSNYDGAGRKASDNNTLFIYLWGAY
jgi:hypothetical protein